MKNIEIEDSNTFRFTSGKTTYRVALLNDDILVEVVEDGFLVSDRRAKIMENKLKKL